MSGLYRNLGEAAAAQTNHERRLSVQLTREEIDDLLSPKQRTAKLLILSHRQDTIRKSAHSKLRLALEQDPHKVLGDSFEDDRGKIQDLIDGPIDSVTRITTLQGAVRGNHVHERTTQWTYVLSGVLRMFSGKREMLVGPGQIVTHHPGEAHAWKAAKDTDCLVFTQGPRAGDQYESDTFRLDTPLVT